MRSGAPTLDLFTSEDASSTLSTEEKGRSEDGPEARAPASVPIEWFAQEQNRLYEEGVKSASSYWLARGRIWP